MKYYVVDTFTDELFRGNSAGVCLLEEQISNDLMQKIAFENRLAETAFIFKSPEAKVYNLQWFTPDMEMDLCGHATLASAYVLMNFVDQNIKNLDFSTKSGILSVSREQDVYKINLPSRMPVVTAQNPLLEQALGVKVLETYLSRDLLVLVENAQQVENLSPNFQILSQISQDISFSIIVSAKGNDCDFVSRFFTPNASIIEDPVTGSAHSTLIPFWSQRLTKKKLLAKQLSPRSGTLFCEELGDRINISGNAVCYLIGEIQI